MNKKQKYIFWIIIIDITILIILILISSSYSVPSNINNLISNTTDKNVLTSTTSNNGQSSTITITEKTSTNTTSNIRQSSTITITEKTSTNTTSNVRQSSTITITEKTSTSKINDNITTDNLEDETYYYSWSNDDSTDFTRRNCLYIYDGSQNKISGEIELIYFEKYKKVQKITNDINNCFLEDKNSVKVNAIIVDGVRYDKIIKR